VLEHCEDAFEYMHRMHRVLKPGGLLIFHERVYDNFWKVLDPARHSSEVAGWHPLRVKRKLVDTLLNLELYTLKHLCSRENLGSLYKLIVVLHHLNYVQTNKLYLQLYYL
jgi:hypothetical protein